MSPFQESNEIQVLVRFFNAKYNVIVPFQVTEYRNTWYLCTIGVRKLASIYLERGKVMRV